MDRGAAVAGASQVAAAIKLRDIRLLKLDFELYPVPIEPPLDVRIDADTSYNLDEGALIYIVAFRVATTPSGEGTDELFSCETRFLVDYEITDAQQDLGEDALEAFGQITVVFSTYPYLREIVQSVTGRAGLTALVLDVIKSPLHLIPSDAGEA